MKNRFNEVKPGDGVYEWAHYSYNIGRGCQRNCVYCYAFHIAKEMEEKSGKCYSRADWPKEIVYPGKAEIDQKVDGYVMMPSMHDITANNIDIFIATTRNILKNGNQILITTKPSLSCIQTICQEHEQYKEQILFRFTIGSEDTNVCKFWEPGAPAPDERIAALEFAYGSGFQTSISSEPMLEGVDGMVALHDRLEPFITDTHWFGKISEINKRVDTSDVKYAKAVELITSLHSDTEIIDLYNRLKNRPKVRWKDSIRKVVGLKQN